jgi:hypothetical protein
MNRIQSIPMVILGLLVMPYQAVAQSGDARRGERMYRACVALTVSMLSRSLGVSRATCRYASSLP